ncbi:hypothetical protein RFI_05214 [Reticulomyxa filosa]|uniref:Uncharacterized protein n=1 Tax=Reticulomyxa filosa TaxID=46433 RepID=X6P023_RETFI|nr:hypothetical protein RFI_05214 [Reticulomyxa filosa]|eukprot:ETO31905.1 hypothetical protein RFI_05214 [Reticulomyxa filosa]
MMYFWLTLSLFVCHWTAINAQATAYTSFRRDYFLSSSMYPENLPDPDVGGRAQIVFTASNYKTTTYVSPFTVSFNGDITIAIAATTVLPSSIDWITCDYNAKTGQVGISMHVPDDDLVQAISKLVVSDSKGQVWARLEITGSSPQQQQQVTVHLYNYYSNAFYGISSFYFNGQSVDKEFTVGPVDHIVRLYNISNVSPGDLWTIYMTLDDGLAYGFAGRFSNALQPFPFVALPVDSQCPVTFTIACPLFFFTTFLYIFFLYKKVQFNFFNKSFPQTNSANYETLSEDLFVSSTYLSASDVCSGTTQAIITAYSTGWNENTNPSGLVVDSQLSSQLTDSNTGTQNAVHAIALNSLQPVDDVSSSALQSTIHNLWQSAIALRTTYPHFMTCVNAQTSHQVGSFAGITDIQVVQFFMAGCATTSVQNTTFPVTAVYDYTSNAQKNQMPLETWAVIQAFDTWSDDSPPYLTPSEITMVIGQVFAAGVQGVILSKTDVTQMSTNSQAWNAANALLFNFNALYTKGYLAHSVATGSYIQNADSSTSLWAAIRSDVALIVIGVNINCSGYDLSKCDGSQNVAWTCEDTISRQVNVTLPTDFNGTSIQIEEVQNGDFVQVDFNTAIVSGQFNQVLQLQSVSLDSQETTRVFLVTIH